MKTKRTGFFLGLTGLALAGLTILQARGAPPPHPTAPPPDQGRVAAEGRVVPRPGAEIVMAAERAGKIVRLLVDENQVVRKGQVVAELGADELEAALAEALARVGEAEAEWTLAERTLSRREDLTGQGILAQQDLDHARRDLDVARARVETARAEVARGQAQLRKMRIVAPIDGTVITRHADAGEFVDAGDPVVALADLTRLRVEGEADESDAGRLRLGAPVKITADSYPGRAWRGEVEELADAVTLRRLKPQDPSRPTDTRILAVKVAFAEPTPLKLGTGVELTIR